MDIIDEVVLEEQLLRTLPVQYSQKISTELFYSIRRLDVIQALVDDPTITEIMINGLDYIFIEQNGCIKCTDLKFESLDKLQNVIQQIVASCNRIVNEASPLVDARLPSIGARVNIVMNTVALNGPIVTIRRFPDKPISIKDLINNKTITEEVANFLEQLVISKYNIFISGGTGSGKTTFLNVLSNFIPIDERIITIEDSAELQLQNIPNLVRLETRNRNVEGCEEITIRDLIRASLRMRPDRIIVGEVRGEETIDMMQCLNTGHAGSMSTGHSNSAADMLTRLENMILMGMDIPLKAIKSQITSGIDIIVHLGRVKDKTRKVLEIIELLELKEGEFKYHSLYHFKERGVDDNGMIIGELEKENELYNLSKLSN